MGRRVCERVNAGGRGSARWQLRRRDKQVEIQQVKELLLCNNKDAPRWIWVLQKSREMFVRMRKSS